MQLVSETHIHGFAGVVLVHIDSVVVTTLIRLVCCTPYKPEWMISGSHPRLSDTE